MEIGENNINISLSSKTIDLQETESYHLSIEISPNKVLFSLLGIENLKYHYFKSLQCKSKDISDLVQLINSEELLKKSYSTSTVSYSHYPSVIIPNTLYDNNKKKEYLEFMSNNIETIKSDNIHQINATILYSIPKNINNIINQIQPKIIEKNSSNILINQLIKQYENIEEKNVFLYINEESEIEIVVLKKNQLLFQNKFSYTSKIDILYYVLFSYEQLNLKTEETILYLFGNIEKGDGIYSLLYDYIRYIQFGELSTSLNFDENLTTISKHQYFILFSQLLCV